MYIANWLVHLLWRRGSDPDNSAIPYLTAVGDLLGTVLLALAFLVLSLISQHVADDHKVKVLYIDSTLENCDVVERNFRVFGTIFAMERNFGSFWAVSVLIVFHFGEILEHIGTSENL